MLETKVDFVIEAVHYKSDGSIDYVRLYERRGPAFSDRVLYSREKLLQALRSKKIVQTGYRLPGLATTFQLTGIVKVEGTNSASVIFNTDETPATDQLADVPIL